MRQSITGKVDEFLGEIRGLARGKVDRSIVGGMLDEVRVHLDASIQARLELGAAPEQAEEEVIEAFGDPAEFVRRMRRQHPIGRSLWFDKHVWLSLLAASLVMSLLLAYSSFKDLSSVSSVIFFGATAVGFCVWIAWSSFRAKRPQFLPLMAFGFILIPLIATAFSCGYVAEPMSPMSMGFSRQVAFNELNRCSRLMLQAKQVETEFTSSAIRYYHGGSPTQPPMKPFWHRSLDSTVLDSFEIRPAGSKAGADLAWRKTLPMGYQRLATEKESLAYQITEFDEMLTRPFWVNAYLYLPAGAFISAGWTMMATGISVGAWLLALILRVWRRRNRPTAA